MNGEIVPPPEFPGPVFVELVYFFLYYLMKFTSEAIWAWSFLWEKVLKYSISLVDIELLELIYFFYTSFGSLYLSRNLSFHLNYWIYWHRFFLLLCSFIILLMSVGSVVIPLSIHGINCLGLHFFFFFLSVWLEIYQFYINFIGTLKELSFGFTDFSMVFLFYILLIFVFYFWPSAAYFKFTVFVVSYDGNLDHWLQDTNHYKMSNQKVCSRYSSLVISSPYQSLIFKPYFFDKMKV